jgi:hypothetical protein
MSSFTHATQEDPGAISLAAGAKDIIDRTVTDVIFSEFISLAQA